MKQYVLFSDEELEALQNGEEIKRHVSGVGELYFMSKEEFRKSCIEEIRHRRLGGNNGALDNRR